MQSNRLSYIGHVIRDPRGRILSIGRPRPTHSLLKQMIQLCMVQFNQSTVSIKDQGGAARSVPSVSVTFKITAAAADTTYGMLIGSGTNPVAIDDFQVQTQLTTNIGHSTHVLSVENPDASTWRMKAARVFTNNTGSVVNVTEVVIYAVGSITPYYFCVERTLYSVAIPIGAALTLNWYLTATL